MGFVVGFVVYYPSSIVKIHCWIMLVFVFFVNVATKECLVCGMLWSLNGVVWEASMFSQYHGFIDTLFLSDIVFYSRSSELVTKEGEKVQRLFTSLSVISCTSWSLCWIVDGQFGKLGNATGVCLSLSLFIFNGFVLQTFALFFFSSMSRWGGVNKRVSLKENFLKGIYLTLKVNRIKLLPRHRKVLNIKKINK